MIRSSLFDLVSKDPVELNSMILKAKLASIIRMMIQRNQWSQSTVAKKIGTTQPRVSNLLGGSLDKFSVDFLLESLCKLGYKLEIDFTPSDEETPIHMTLKKAVL